MAIPDYQTLMLPVLRATSDGQEHQMKGVIAQLIDQYDMTDEEKTRLLPSGTTHVFASRVGWAKTYLKQAGLLSSPRRGVFKITTAGRELLAENPAGIDNTLLSNYPEFLDFRERSHASEPEAAAQAVDLPLTQTPEDAMATAYKRLRSELEIELLEQVKKRQAQPSLSG